MLLTTAIIILAAASLAALGAGFIIAARQFGFLVNAHRVQGTVMDEWRYRIYGRSGRYYRVEFCLNNGQRASLRGSGSAPPVGQAVTVLVREGIGLEPKARIDRWLELWWPTVVLLFIGLLGALMTASVIRSAWV